MRRDDDSFDDNDVAALVSVPDVIVRPDVLTLRPVASRGVPNRANIFAHASAFSIAYFERYLVVLPRRLVRSLVDLGCVRPAGVHGCAQQATARAAAAFPSLLAAALPRDLRPRERGAAGGARSLRW